MDDGKIGLALGGGAARGWAHIGVLRALIDAGIKPDVIAGTSIGAVVGACYACDHLDALEEFARGLTVRRVWSYLDFNLAGTGLITGSRLAAQLSSTIGPRLIEELPVRFTAVATEIGTGHEIWLSRGSLSEAVRASYALPGIFKPVKLNNRWLFDGALVNPVPISVCRALGARYVIAVNLNFDLSSRGTVAPQFDVEQFAAPACPDPGSGNGNGNGNANANGNGMEPGPRDVRGPRAQRQLFGARSLLQRQIFGKGENAPGISTVMVDAFNIVQDRIARSRLAGDPPDAMITPRLFGVNLFDFHRADELIALGRKAAEREIEVIKQEIEVRRRIGRLSATSA